MADALFTSSRVRSRHAHWQTLGERSQLFVVNGSRVFDVDHDVIGQLEAAAQLGETAVQDVLGCLGLLSAP